MTNDILFWLVIALVFVFGAYVVYRERSVGKVNDYLKTNVEKNALAITVLHDKLNNVPQETFNTLFSSIELLKGFSANMGATDVAELLATLKAIAVKLDADTTNDGSVG